MAYDAKLEMRIDVIVEAHDLAVQRKNMFGGVGYIINGNMAFGIQGSELIVRTTEEEGERLLKQKGTRHFAMGSRSSKKNWYLAGGEAIINDEALEKLILLSVTFAQKLQPKG